MNRRVFTALICLMAVACTPGIVPVIDKSPNRVIPPQIVVRKGDTLYSIAFQYGLNYQHVARWNGIRKPYLIKAGQRLYLRPQSSTQTASVAQAPKTTPAKPKTTTQPSSSLPRKAPSKWNWPARGKLIGKFSRSKGENGIKIAGADGSAIRSTAAGEVVYAGEGLRGYGKLIIVKHSPDYLSAYAHNRKILVAEGERIQSGQQIAQMGNTGTDRTMLHFEIRKDGKPVDPLKFLN